MKPGELTRRNRAKAIQLLAQLGEKVRFTTTQALCLIEAECGAVKLHRLLATRGLAARRKDLEGGYDFAAELAAYGESTFSIEHHSFQWSLRGLHFIAHILDEEGIAYKLPENLPKKSNITV